MISLADVEKLAEQTAKYHHPHYQGVSKNEYNSVRFNFKPFTGAEEEPTRPRDLWDDDSLSREAHGFVSEQYEAARILWRDAKYVRGLQTAALGAQSLWDDYIQARSEMSAAFAALDATPDTQWRSTISLLIAAQEKSLAAASKWDGRAEGIARVHYKFLYSGLSHAEAYKRAGVDAGEWVIGDVDDYSGWCSGAPLTKRVTEAVDQQREHLRKIASLTGDRQN